MIETRVRVVSHADGVSFVEATERNGCGACVSQSSCGISGLGRFFARQRPAIPVRCGDTRPGQELTLAVSEPDLLRVGLWAYLLPVVLALLGAGLASPRGDAATAAGLFTGLAAGLLLARRFARGAKISITSGA